MALTTVTLKDYPPISLRDFLKGSQSEKMRLAAELKERLDTFGFMVFSDHGVSLNLLDSFYKVSKEFFAKDIDLKQNYKAIHAGLNGYFPYLFETAVTSRHPDLKEFWHVLREAKNTDGTDMYPPNRWPREVPEFGPVAMKLYQEMDECSMNIMRMMSTILGVDESYFEKICENGCSTLRTIHYPPVRDQKSDDQIRAGTHTGIQLIGLQPKASHPGLQFLTHAQEWVKLSPEFEPYLSVNVGDMLQAISNSQLRATPHRVVNPLTGESNEARYAIVYFFHANPGAFIEPLSHLPVRDGYTPFRKMRAWDWLQERIQQISRNSVIDAD